MKAIVERGGTSPAEMLRAGGPDVYRMEIIGS
jgi:hypothetical protein